LNAFLIGKTTESWERNIQLLTKLEKLEQNTNKVKEKKETKKDSGKKFNYNWFKFIYEPNDNTLYQFNLCTVKKINVPHPTNIEIIKTTNWGYVHYDAIFTFPSTSWDKITIKKFMHEEEVLDIKKEFWKLKQEDVVFITINSFWFDSCFTQYTMGKQYKTIEDLISSEKQLLDKTTNERKDYDNIKNLNDVVNFYKKYKEYSEDWYINSINFWTIKKEVIFKK